MLRDQLFSGLFSKHIAILTRETTLCVILRKSDEYNLLNQYLNSPLRWVHQMGFKRDVAKKSYYADGHERPDQQHYRSQVIKDYLTRIEPRCH